MSDDSWIEVLSVNDEVDANLKKGFLEENGIECLIEASTFPAYPHLNEYRLTVPWEKAIDARELLKQLG